MKEHEAILDQHLQEEQQENDYLAKAAIGFMMAIVAIGLSFVLLVFMESFIFALLSLLGGLFVVVFNVRGLYFSIQSIRYSFPATVEQYIIFLLNLALLIMIGIVVILTAWVYISYVLAA